MAFTETLRLLVDMDTKGAVSNVEKLGTSAEKSAKKGEQGLDKWGKKMTSAGAGMVAFGAVALAGLGAAAMASEEAQLSVLKLENTLKNAPKLAGESSKQFIDLAESIQDVTAADADQIVEAEAMLGTFSLTAKEIKGITPLVVDYARKFGVDLPNAAVQVGKALDGSIGALKKNGVSIDETLYKTDRYAAVQKALSEQVGGFAEEEGKTFAGSLQRLKNQLGDLVEGVGSGAVDAFTSLAKVTGGLSDRLNEMSPATQSMIGKIATFGAVGIIAAGGLSMVVGKVIVMRENLSLLASGLSNTKEKLGGLAGAGANAAVFAGGVLLLGEAMDALFPIPETNLARVENDLVKFNKSGKLAGEAMELLGDDFSKLHEATATIFDSSTMQNMDHALSWATTFGGTMGDVRGVDEAKRMLDDLDETLVSLAAQDPDAAAKLFKSISEEMQKSGASVDDVKGAFDKYDSTLAKADTTTRLASDAVGENAEAMDDSAESTEDAKTALQEYADAQRAAMDPLFGFNDALLANQEAQGKVVEAELKVAAAEADVAKARKEHGDSSDEATEAAFKLIEAENGLDEAHRNAVESALDYQSAFADLKASMETGNTTVAEAKATIDRWSASGLFGADTAAFYKGEVDKLTAAINKQPARSTTVVSAFNAVQAREQIDRVRFSAESLDGKVYTVRLKTIYETVQMGSKGGPGFKLHEGGMVPGPRGHEIAGVLLGQEEVLHWDDPRHSANLARDIAPQSSGGWMGAAAGGGDTYVSVSMAGAIIASQSDADRWVATAWNRAAEHNLVTVRGRPL
jgi:hypothetical protein